MNFRNSTSLSAAVLCAMATFAVGCADAGDNEPAAGTQKAAITSRGIAVNGCAGTALFNIMNAANFNTAINAVAIDQSAINNVTSQLWAVNSQNQLVQVTEAAQQVSQNMATALSAFTNNTTAFQRAAAWQSANAATFAAGNTTTIASHYDAANTWNNSFTDVYSANSGFASQNAAAYNTAWGNALAARNANTGMMASQFVDSVNGFSSFQSNAAFISNNFLGGFDAFGLAGFNAAGISDVAFANGFANAFGTNRAAAANTAWANTNVADLARSGFLTSAYTNTNAADAFFNSARAVNQQANQASVVNAATTATTASFANAAATSTNAMQDALAAENAFATGSNAVASNNFMSAAQAFTNLTQFHSQNYVLQLNFSAAAEQAFTSLYALNQNNNILASNNFAFAFPGCGVGGVGVGPMILPPEEEGAAVEAAASPIEVGPALAREERE